MHAKFGAILRRKVLEVSLGRALILKEAEMGAGQNSRF